VWKRFCYCDALLWRTALRRCVFVKSFGLCGFLAFFFFLSLLRSILVGLL
jgi:hypothetical protein